MRLAKVAVFGLVGFLLLAGLVKVSNDLVVKPIRLHFALEKGCKIFDEVGVLDSNSSETLRAKKDNAFLDAAHIDANYLPLAEAGLVVGTFQGKLQLTDYSQNKLTDAVFMTVAFCGAK